MKTEIIPAYEYPQIVKELFTEYLGMIEAGDSNIVQYLVMQNYDEEIQHLDRKYGQPWGRIYLLRCDGDFAGCIALRRIDDNCGELKRMYVRSAYRGKGFGEQLVKRIITDAGEIGYKYILLDTLPFLESAIRLYHRCGFYDIASYNDSPMKESIYMRFDLSAEK